MRIVSGIPAKRAYSTKRVADVAMALTGLAFLLPVILCCALILLLLSGENPFFFQVRVGLHERLFTIIKLKTLFTPAKPVLYHTGILMRKYSLDELPQLVNVIRGDMSLVGPRPLLPEYIPFYNDTQRTRHAVRPGMTGWAQIHGRNSLSWQEKFTLDVWYVQRCSFALDFRILLHTLLQCMDTTHVKPQGLTEAEKFKGNSYQH